MQTIDATLKAALATGHFVPYFKLRVYRNGSLLDTLQVMKYKLTGMHLTITVRGMVVVSTSPDAVKVILDRGITSLGTNYILSSSKFSPIKGIIEYLGYPRYFAITTVLEASVVPPKALSFAGDVSYHDAITSFCTAIGKTAVFKVPGAAYWGYKFLPAGKTVTFNDANRFLPLLRQKYFIFACDNGNEEILFYQAFDIPGSPDAQLQSLLSEIGTGYFQRRRFMARDEVGSIRYAGTAGDAIHNLGYLESTAAMPAYFDQRQPISVRWPINLEYQDGDYQRVDDSYDVFPLQVTEVFDPKASPGWCTIGAQEEYFANTEGGALPSTIERVSNYTPLNVSTFNKNLDSSINNIQALAERVDDLVLGSSISSGQTFLGSSFSISGGLGVYQDTGLSVSLPGAGTYIIQASARCDLKASGGTPPYWITAKFYNSTLGADVANSPTLIMLIYAAASEMQATGPMRAVVTVSNASIIKLYAFRNAVSAPTWAVSAIASDVNGYTSMSYLKIA